MTDACKNTTFAHFDTRVVTRMHSSRMRTNRCSGRHQMPVLGKPTFTSRPPPLSYADFPSHRPSPPVSLNRMTHVSEDDYLPLQSVIVDWHTHLVSWCPSHLGNPGSATGNWYFESGEVQCAHDFERKVPT